MSQPIRILYMGTPDFAVEPLDRLLDAGYEVCGVVTAPDRPAGRGRQLQESPVKQFAKKKGLEVLQPERLRDEAFLTRIDELDPTLGIVVAFRMLPKILWDRPTLGTFNLHASLLPQYRGAAPINWVLINGEKETGVTTFFLDEKIDTGQVLLQEKLAIEENETAGSLHDRLMHIGASLVVSTVKAIEEESIQAQPQSQPAGELLKTAPKLFKEDGKINWNEEANKILNKIRGLSPYPAAWSELKDENTSKNLSFKIYDAHIAPCAKKDPPGSVYTDHKTFLEIKTAGDCIRIDVLQPAGKKRMDVAEWLRGLHTFNYTTTL